MLSMASDRVNGENDFNISTDQLCNVGSSSLENHTEDDDVQVNCFTEDLSDVTFHFQIIRLKKQIYAWIGCNSVKAGAFICSCAHSS
ncbi:hypothetical protein QJS10_CPB19g00399 [Acorus calamus]|uniref:Proteasome assembly chaperone 4 n=1 Tax=Acorus calamus TaxID=4465 RepID=A0AAV9CG25_ACOCL|nr:hypothetical protein QJS10_CPB19g00399 [Acorus calamus]